MPVTVAQLQEALRTVADRAYVTLEPGDARVGISTRRFDRWRVRNRPERNRQTIHLFIDSIRAEYGGGIARQLINASFIEWATQRGEPLRARHIRDFIDRANHIRATAPPIAREVSVRTAGTVQIRPQLAQELQTALNHGFVNRFVLEGDPEIENPMPQASFLKILTVFNATMADLHQRFPALADIRPPNLSQSDYSARHPGGAASYASGTETIAFAYVDPAVHAARHFRGRAMRLMSPKAPGLQGVLTHEYSHHIASPGICDNLAWQTKLLDMLQQSGIVCTDTSIDAARPDGPEFESEVGVQVVRLGLGTYAGRSMDEFAAEALAWRLAPGYGESSDIPPMPSRLEQWVHECFPATRGRPVPPRIGGAARAGAHPPPGGDPARAR